MDHEDVGLAMVHPHQCSTAISAHIFNCRFSLLQHWRCIGRRSSDQWCWDDLECLLKHSSF